MKRLFTKYVLLIEGTGQQVPVAKSRGAMRALKRPLQGDVMMASSSGTSQEQQQWLVVGIFLHHVLTHASEIKL